MVCHNKEQDDPGSDNAPNTGAALLRPRALIC